MWTKERKIQEEMEMASATSVFAPGLNIKGNVEASSDIRIEGDVLGDVTTGKKVIVGISGKIIGNIRASEICVMGEVKGDIFVNELARFTAEARMRGNVYSGKIEIESGADMEVTLSKPKKNSESKDSETSDAGHKGLEKRHTTAPSGKEMVKIDD
ncbi:protein CcmA, bactofilin family [Cyclobacterium lianum]|uniref:Protein CcmA, bactofilin family n=1 Tax=Cyclobacterium lianum TaxID=388280 RepID=A0A1M7NHE6_9BACT|nr:polymer-forming cytoskeletal protein [Cyclobacterium lianum]SHN03246.1 protein CcmA, bactofilin family [Cyclobacterium lianum]